MALAQTIVSGLGYQGAHFSADRRRRRRVWQLAPAGAVAKRRRSICRTRSARRSISSSITSPRHAPDAGTDSAAAGAPYGRSSRQGDLHDVHGVRRRLPRSALLDSKETPQLRFIERNCVQCGLCAKTCPEDAITLVPRLLLRPEAKEAVVLNETEPFNCVRCAKPFGTRQMIDNMLGSSGPLDVRAGGAAPAPDVRRLPRARHDGKKTEASIFDFPKPMSDASRFS